MKTVLIVEDNEDNMDVLEAILEDDFELIYARNGRSGLEQILKKKPDLVLLDISLPEMDGNDVIRAVRADKSISTTPVIALTAHAMAGDKERFIATGFDDYMSKPIVDDDALIAMMNHLLND